MKIAIITDTHFGARNDSNLFRSHQTQFNSEVLLPYLIDNEIKTLFHLGDFYDKRKNVDFVTYSHSKEEFLRPILDAGIEIHLLVGNHDSYYKNEHEIVSTRELFSDMIKLNPHFHIHDKPIEIEKAGCKFLLCPWINKKNEDDILGMIESTTASICCGHFEMSDIQMSAGVFSTGGMSKDGFHKFDTVFSGHYHRPSVNNGNIVYVGSPYQFTWNDYGDEKGFIVYDTETGETCHRRNPVDIFEKITYDEELAIDDFPYDVYGGCIVRVLVEEKNNEEHYDAFMTKLTKANPFSLDIVEKYLYQFQAGEDIDTFDKDTLTILVENVESDDLIEADDKITVIDIMTEIYEEATGTCG